MAVDYIGETVSIPFHFSSERETAEPLEKNERDIFGSIKNVEIGLAVDYSVSCIAALKSNH